MLLSSSLSLCFSDECFSFFSFYLFPFFPPLFLSFLFFFIGAVGISQSLQCLGYTTDDQGTTVWFPALTGNIFLPQSVQARSGAHSASHLTGTGGSFSGVRWPKWGWSSSATFENEWSYTATSPYAFVACIATILALPLPLVFAVPRTRRHTFPFQFC